MISGGGALERAEQLLRFLDDGRQVAALAGEGEAEDAERDLKATAALGGDRIQSPKGEPEVPLRLFQGSSNALIAGHQRHEFGLCGDHAGRKGFQELVRAGGLAVQFKAKPMV